ADLIQHVDRARLAFPQLLDEDDALLELGLSLLELLNLKNDRVEPRRFLLRVGDIHVELLRLVVEREVPPADRHHGEYEHRRTGDRDFLTGLERGLLLGAFALDGKEVDANHRSPALLSASPTATAAVGMTPSTSITPSLSASNITVLNGSSSSTEVPNLSSRALTNPSTLEAPPLRSTRSM